MENKQTKKELTLDDIAELIKVSANETTKTLEIKIESSVGELAAMTQGHFLNLETDIKELKKDTEEIKTNLNKKADIFTHNDLEYRVEKLENKVGVTMKKNLAAA